MATLRIFRGDQFVAPFELGEGRTRIGRGTENQLVLEDRDKQVSRTHAEIRHERGEYLITDLNSQNGVWIGERQIKSEEAVPVNVPVTIGPYRLILVPDEPPQPSAGVVGVPATAPESYVEPTQLGELPTIPPPPSRAVQPAPAPPAPAPKPSTPARTQTGKTPAPAAAGSKRIVIIGGAIAAVLIAVLAVAFLRKSPAPQGTVASDSSTTSSTTSTVPAPAAPTPEEVFQDHYSKAQTLIAEGNKTGARDENTAALAALPTDQRGLDQLKAIDGMTDPNAPPGTTTPVPNPKPVPTGPEWLRVQAKPGEAERDRANREKLARGQLDEGRKALNEHRLDTAVSQLLLALTNSGRPDFGAEAYEASTLLARAKKEQAAAIATARRAAAEKALAEARGLASSDIPAAWQKLLQARGLDPNVNGLADLESTLQEQARIQGENALSSAKNLDARSRALQAIPEYERAIRLLEILPGGHKDLAFAKLRISELNKR